MADNDPWKELTIKHIKGLLDAQGVSSADCFEKQDLINKAKAAGISPTDQPIIVRMSTVSLAGLHCAVVTNGLFSPASPPNTVVVIMHGYGASEDDLSPLGEALLSKHIDAKAKRVAILFPRAPLTLSDPQLPTGGYAWWPVNWQAMMSRAMSGQLLKVLDDEPEGLQAAVAKVTDLLAAVQTHFGVDVDRVILGGFSQGAILATQVGLSLPKLPLGLCLYSGALYARKKLVAHLARHGDAVKGLRVFQSHGLQDMVLPYLIGDALKQLLESNEVKVDFVQFNGGHTIPPEGLPKLAALVRDL